MIISKFKSNNHDFEELNGNLESIRILDFLCNNNKPFILNGILGDVLNEKESYNVKPDSVNIVISDCESKFKDNW